MCNAECIIQGLERKIDNENVSQRKRLIFSLFFFFPRNLIKGILYTYIYMGRTLTAMILELRLICKTDLHTFYVGTKA